MRLLLDTHALLWWLGDDDNLGPQARSLFADPDNPVLVGVASLWEIVVKVRVGDLQAEIREIEATIARDDFVRLDILPAHLAALNGLPTHLDHPDPFDHLLIAQAISEDALQISEDRHAARHPVRTARCSDPAA